MALFTDRRELDQQAKARELRAVTDPDKVRAMKMAGFDQLGRTTGWGKFLDALPSFGIRQAVAKKQATGTDARRVLDETTDEMWKYQLDKLGAMANVGMTAATMGGSQLAGGGGGGAMGFLGNLFQGKNKKGMDAGSGVGGGTMPDGGVQGGNVQGTGVPGTYNPGYQYGEGTMSDPNGLKTNTVTPIGNSNNKLGGKNYPDGTYLNDEGILVDKDGNPVDYDQEAENNDKKNTFGDFMNTATNNNLFGSVANTVMSGIDYYNEQEEELNKLRKQNVMDAFAFL